MEEVVSDTLVETTSGPRLSLVLRGPNLPGIGDVEIPVTNRSSTIFSVVQALMHTANFPTRQERLRRIWEPTYV